MASKPFKKMRVDWFNLHERYHEWKVGERVYCRRCCGNCEPKLEGSFLAEDVAEDNYYPDRFTPCCPKCGADSSYFFKAK
jgi:hypothetical protein